MLLLPEVAAARGRWIPAQISGANSQSPREVRTVSFYSYLAKWALENLLTVGAFWTDPQWRHCEEGGEP